MDTQKARSLANYLREIYREADPRNNTYRPKPVSHRKAVVRGASKAVSTIKAVAFVNRLAKGLSRP